MPRFVDNDQYSNVNEIADRNGLIWDGQYGSPYDIESLIEKALRDRDEMQRYSRLFDHTKRFKPRGSGKKAPVMAISSPYLADNDELRSAVAAFATRFGLDAVVNDSQYRVYAENGTIPIVFWRPDLHTLA
ncbi:hypothetical protein DEU34_3074 [Microbacterium sp. AG1240]|uniref:hypothetical protein n=1 Tax=Microbacterium sp. AG1240 TaxID=2183992 RepID=UPI000EB419CC|nr:hypothetical protein [Microbacterium sp. AG1240]RKT31137.1 hypothetical protein DEU34_3074 [Microbacterium sp. AG1240]